MIIYNYVIINTLIFLLYFCCILIIFKLLFIDQIKWDSEANNKCIGFECKGNDCIGTNCNATSCVGENCEAGNCYGIDCKAGDCYGYGCKPGICYDTVCNPGKCPQLNKKCKDGIAYRIKENLDIYRKFPYGTLFNPSICKKEITANDILMGRADTLGIKNVYAINNKITSSTPELIKNYNCELCATINNVLYCKSYVPVIENNVTIWK